MISGPTAVHFVAIDADGSAYTWGRNDKGACGTGKTTNVYRATKVAGVTGVVGAACGKQHTLLLTGSGELWAAGSGEKGQLGIGRVADAQLSFTRAAKGLPEATIDPVVKVSAGSEFSIALTKSGRVFACGSAENGHLGNGTTGERIVSAGRVGFDSESSWILVPFPAGTSPVVDVACGECSWFTVHLQASPAGSPSTAARHVVLVALFLTHSLSFPFAYSRLRPFGVTAGGNHTAALCSDGTVWTWGLGSYGRLGHTKPDNELKPRRMEFTVRAWETHTLATA